MKDRLLKDQKLLWRINPHTPSRTTKTTNIDYNDKISVESK